MKGILKKLFRRDRENEKAPKTEEFEPLPLAKVLELNSTRIEELQRIGRARKNRDNPQAQAKMKYAIEYHLSIQHWMRELAIRKATNR